MRKFLAILTILSSYTLAVYGQWQTVDGPDGSDIKSLISDGSNLFTGTTNGVYTLDGSGSWLSLGKNLPNQNISAVADMLYILFAATADGVYRTDDNGSTWSLVLSRGDCNYLYVTDEEGTPVIYAVTPSNIYKSLNFGISWSNIGMDGVYSIRFVNNNLFAATTWGIGLYRYNGTFWSDVTLEYTGGSQGFTAIGNTLYIIKNSRLYSSTDNGLRWTFQEELEGGSGYLTSIGNTLYFSNALGLKKSVNGGNSWSFVGAVTGLKFNTIILHGANLYAASISGVYKSEDDGTSWTMFSKGLSPRKTFIRLIGSNLWVGTDSGLFVSDNNGTSWSHVTDVTGYLVSCIYSEDGNSIYVGTSDRGVFYSDDAGQSWTCINPDIRSIRSITKSNNDLYVSSISTGLYRMREGAWSNISTINFTSLASKNGMLYAANNQAFYSADGVNWTVSPLTPGQSRAAVYNINDTIFISSGVVNFRFHYSTDGLTWTQPAGFFNFGFVYDIIGHDNKLYVATDLGIYRSIDHATSWHQINSPSSTLVAVQNNTIYSGKHSNRFVKKEMLPEFSYSNDLTLFTGLLTKPSETQRFVIRYDLLPGDISVSVGSGFEFQVYGDTFYTSYEIKLANSRVVVLYLRLNRDVLGPVADYITIQCIGMPTLYVPINGLVLEKFSQTIDFSEIENTNTTIHSVGLTATASSGLPISFETNTDIISISGNRAYILGAGEVTITAHQLGNEIFWPAEDVSRTFTVDLVLGIEQDLNSDSHVYPNPTSGKLRLADNAEVIGLTNVMGQPQPFECISGTLDLQGLPPGVYLLKIKKEFQTYTTRIVKN